MKNLILILIAFAMIGLSALGQIAYITNSGDGTVSVINVATNTVTATIPVAINPQGVSVSHDGSKVYVTHANTSTASVINTYNNTVSDRKSTRLNSSHL